MNIIESAKAASEVATAMALGGAALKSIAKTTSVEAVDRVMDEIHEAADRMAEVQQALAAPAAGDFLDEDELDAELAELEALEADSALLEEPALPDAPTRVPAPPLRMPSAPTARPVLPAAAVGAGGGGLSAEERELEELQAAMAA
jgi:charged multivesicular body protein 4